MQDGISKTLESYFAKQSEGQKSPELPDCVSRGLSLDLERCPEVVLCPLDFSLVFGVCVFFLSFYRVGEATVPGPSDTSPDAFVDAPSWTLCIGVGNPSGINNKLYTLDFFPRGFHLAETQASRAQQILVQSHLRAVSARQNRNLRSCVGAPAPLRPGPQHAGSWTGVLNFGDCHLRQVPSF